MLLYVVTYDISCNKRRKKVSDLLAGYGERVQYSVFECVLSKEQYAELRRRLRKRIKEGEDSIRFYPLSKHTLVQVEIWGKPPTHQPGTPLDARAARWQWEALTVQCQLHRTAPPGH